MKFAWPKLIASMFAAMALCTSAAVTAAENFDFDKINASLKTALTEFSADSRTATLMYRFDPKGTDVAQNRYLFDLNLRVPKTAWKQALQASGSFGFRANMEDQADPGLFFSIDANYETDTLRMLEHKLTKVSRCHLAANSSGLGGVLWRRHCEYVAALPRVQSVAALHDLLAAKLTAHREDVTQYMASVESVLAQLPPKTENEEVVRLLQTQLKSAQGVLTFFNGVALSKTKDGFILDIPAFSGCPVVNSSGLKLDISPTSVKVRGEVRLKFAKNLYAAAKPIMIEVMQGLEQGDPTAMKLVKLDAEMFSNLIMGAMEGEF